MQTDLDSVFIAENKLNVFCFFQFWIYSPIPMENPPKQNVFI